MILDMVGGDYIQRNIAAAAIWGRIVNIAYQERRQGARWISGPMLRKRLTLAATTLRGAVHRRERRHPRRPCGARSGRWSRRARSGRWWTGVFPLAEAQAAHDFMAKTGHIGKILLVPDRS